MHLYGHHRRSHPNLKPPIRLKDQASNQKPKQPQKAPNDAKIIKVNIRNHASFLADVSTYKEQVAKHATCNNPWSLRRARNHRGKFTSYEKPWSSRYDVRGTLIGSGLVVTTCEEPSGKVYVVRETLVKSLRHARNLDWVWSGRYDMRGTVGESLHRVRNLGQVATTCEEP
ncbi:hypothetical protein Tco_1247090 [Tanacetum coccineum]